MTTIKNNSGEKQTDREIVITRLIDAPRELVWEAWTDPKQVVKWWGPNGFSTTIEKMDVRVGGIWKHVMHGPDGTDYPNLSVFKEIVKPERIVYQHAGGIKERGGACFKGTWTFEDQGGGKTKLTLRLIFASSKECDHTIKEYQAIEGGNQTLGRLSEYLAKMGTSDSNMKPFVISRVFNAPRELVWKAFTDPEHMKHWWGPKGAVILDYKMDLRPGGINHYGMRYGGQDMWGKFVYREIVAPERLVFVNSFADEKGGLTRHPLSKDPWPLEMLSTLTFTEQNGKTTLTIEWVPINSTQEERDTFEKGRDGMKQGWTGTLDQLENYLAKL